MKIKRKLKNIMYLISGIALISTPIFGVASCGTSATESKYSTRIIQGQQFLEDYYNYSKNNYGDSMRTIINRLDKFEDNYAENIRVTPIKIASGIETYDVNLDAISFNSKIGSNHFDFKVSLDLNKNYFIPNYTIDQKLGSSFSHNFGNPMDSGSDVALTKYFEDNKDFLLKWIKAIAPDIDDESLPRSQNPIDHTYTGFDIIYSNVDCYVGSIEISWFNIDDTNLGFKLSYIFDKATGIMTFPELLNL